jgi:2OG-Fe(II) oxygenase superfamily
MIKEFFVGDEVSNYFNLLLLFISDNFKIFKDNKNSSLSSNCFSTLNLLDIIRTEKFYNYIGILQSLCEQKLNLKLKYFYVHMIDYENGGEMKVHQHLHNEDYSFILYLNSCTDGKTILHLGNKKQQITPIKNKVLLFSSDIPHSAEYSNSKKVLVGGLKLR